MKNVGAVFVLILFLDHFRIFLVKEGKTQESAKKGVTNGQSLNSCGKKGLKSCILH